MVVVAVRRRDGVRPRPSDPWHRTEIKSGLGDGALHWMREEATGRVSRWRVVDVIGFTGLGCLVHMWGD